jgi:hypothetical protein
MFPYVEKKRIIIIQHVFLHDIMDVSIMSFVRISCKL